MCLLSGCLFSPTVRYLEVHGTAPTPSTLPLLVPSKETRASLRAGVGLASTTAPATRHPYTSLDVRIPETTWQIDGLLSLGSHVVLGYRQVPEGGDLLLGITGRPGPFEILGYGAAGLRHVGLDRTFTRSNEEGWLFSDNGPDDTLSTSDGTLGLATTIGLSCLTSLADRRLQPFLSASLQMGPRLAGDSGSTPREEALTFGAATFDLGARAHLTPRIAATAGAGLVRGTGTFDDTWARGFATMEWTLRR